MPPTLYRLLVIFYIYGHVAGDDFRPTPIPLDEWRPDESRERAGTLHETIKTASPPNVVALPAHYWEDALRHSVYLTLVRDKVDKLIAKGDLIAPNSTPNQHNYHETDDQDLWEKIKVAPFEKLKEDDPTTYGDVTILARGRLLEEHGGYRFVEDDKSKEKCDNDACMDGVKAFWSVKRVRQRDQETSPGRYHYELTFSVMSQLPKRQNKPYEHPIRTFTVQENENKPLEPTKPYHKSTQGSRPERAIWFHKNIQSPQYRKRTQSGLDRLFSSWFDYDDDEPSYDLPRRYKQTSYHPSFSQYSKVGAGGVSSEYHSQEALPYPYKSYIGKYNSHPLSTPPISHTHHHFEAELGGINNPYISQTDYRASGINNIQRTTRPAVLPTPLPPLPSTPKEAYTKKNYSVKHDMFENLTNSPEIASVYKQYNKMKTHMRVSPFPEQLRPPIYNAPPGIFVTMDKKPFKPMPQLKIPIAKPLRTNKPIDFRPSPQVLDVQFSEPDPLFDTVFRPITINYFDSSNTTEKTPSAEVKGDRGEETIRKPTVTAKRPLKKHDNAMKTQKTTTATPDIITATNSSEQEDDMEWADILGIFTKTTPMEPQKEKSKISPTTTPLPPTPSVSVTTTTEPTTRETPTTPASTTVKSKKRTRPPPKFNKVEKIKKHKRITSTTTTTTTSTTTATDAPATAKITEEKKKKRLKQELTQQASKNVTSTTRPKWEPSSKTTSTTPFSTIGITTTSYPLSTTKITTTTMAVEDPASSAVRSKSVNRFRQSTLMIKGTSLKHDRWTVSSPVPEKLRGQSAPSSFTQRRKGSNFHGYVSSTPKTLDETQNIHEHIDYGTTLTSSSPKSEESTIQNKEVSSTITTVSEETNVPLTDSMVESDNSQDNNEENYEESRDHNEYIFPPSDTNNNRSNELAEDIEDILTTENIISTTPHSLLKRKKCKKKHQNLKIEGETKNSYELKDFTTTVASSTTPLTNPNILEDFLNDFPFVDSDSESPSTVLKQNLDKEQNSSHEQYFGEKDDLEELLETLKNNDKYEELSNDEYETEEENEEDDDDNDDEDEENEKEHLFEEDDTSFHSTNNSPHISQKDYENNENRPFTLLELMAME